MIGQFLRLISRGVADLGLHPWAQFFTLAAVTLAAFLAGLFMLFLTNLDSQLVRHRGRVQFQIYWQTSATTDQVAAAWKQLRAMDDLRDLVTFSPADALTELMSGFGQDADQAWLKGEAPLPATALATFEVKEDNQEWTKQLYDKLMAIDGVAEVHFNPVQMGMARTWIAVSRHVIWPLIAVLGLVAGLIVGNTIKLSLVSRADEVEILRLVGARQWYIELPLLAGGAAQGLAGSGLALGFLLIFQMSVKNLLNTAPLFITINFIPWTHALALAAGLTLVGTLSSWVAVKH